MPDVLDATGLTTKTLSELLAELVAAFKVIYGPNINVDQNSPDGQSLNIYSQGGVDYRELLTSIYNSFDPDMNDALLYGFEVALDGGFTAVILRKDAVVEGESGSTSIEVDVELEENTTYYWRAKASDSETVSAWVSSSFFVDNINDVPTVPAVESPVSGSETLSLRPRLSVFNAEDLNADTLSYLFEIDVVDNFSSPAKQSSGLLAEGAALTTWFVAVALTDNTTYYWRVKASDGI